MLAYSNMPSDVRIIREAEALVEKGNNVDIICLRDKNDEEFENYNNINIYRVNLKKMRGGMGTYLWNYNLFVFLSMFKLLKLNKKRKYSHIHIHNPPDNLIFAALPLKLFQNIEIILDVHDPMPEIFASRFEKNMNSLSVKSIRFLEYMCCKLSDKIITVNDTIRNNFNAMGIDNVFVVMNSPDDNLFTEEKRTTPKEKFGMVERFVVLYEGSIMKRRGLHILVEAVYMLKDKIPNISCIIVGNGDYLIDLQNKVHEFGLEKHVKLLGQRPVEEMPEYVAISDVCVIPFTNAPINNIGTPNKLFEYMIYDKPIIVPRLQAMSEILSEDKCLFFEPENSCDLAKCIMQVFTSDDEINDRISRTKEVYKKYKWSVMKRVLYECYNT
jgi:glycosyltransferase involved in cell wall biosynthesis